MPTPQSGIIPEANSDALFITLTIKQDASSLSSIKSVCASIPSLTATLAQQYPDARLSSTVSIGSSAWDKLFPMERPAELKLFPVFEDRDRKAPSTPGDLLLHIRSNRKDISFSLLKNIMGHFGNTVEVQEEVSGFRYLESRDLTGFVDGTENPEGDNRAAVALVSDSDPAFAGGSYIHCQRYIHHLPKWEKQPIDHQEQIIGRTKIDDVEFTSEQKAPTAHIKRVNLKDDHGKSMEILRHSMPYGGAKESGLFFISYGKTPTHFEKMLEAMIRSDSHGHYDHLMDFTTAVTGCAFFAPSIEFLNNKS
ncbi:peroxidase [Endozoicomonas sp. (ex Bugula neritina AB1)]|nr:peroxidase [Endozoicomonas sp. (ex Bugula neritina AB1)]